MKRPDIERVLEELPHIEGIPHQIIRDMLEYIEYLEHLIREI